MSKKIKLKSSAILVFGLTASLFLLVFVANQAQADSDNSSCDPKDQAAYLNDESINLKLMKDKFADQSKKFIAEIDSAVQGGCFVDQTLLGLFQQTKDYQEKLQQSVINHIDRTIERVQQPITMPEGNEGTCGPAFHTMVKEINDREDVVNRRREKVSRHVESEEHISQLLSEPKKFDSAKAECIFRVFDELNSIREMAKKVVRVAKEVELGFRKNKKRLTCYRYANREIEAKCEVGSKSGGSPIGVSAGSAESAGAGQTGFTKGVSGISEDPAKKNSNVK